VIEILIWLLVALLLLPVWVIAFECFFSLLPVRSKNQVDAERLGLVVLIPAHNESAVISDTLASIMPQLQVGDRMLVVADNCTDDTALIASSMGAIVLERHDEEERGKGFALAYGIEMLHKQPPEVLVMVDADCIVTQGSIDTLARDAARYNQPIQALDLMHAGAEASLKIKVAAFAWMVKNKMRALGLSRLGLPVQLMGTGMAFPWHIIKDMDMGGDAIVEDMQMGIELAIQGYPTRFCPEALVSSVFPSSESDAGTQRKRWEHGHIMMILNNVPRLFIAAIRKKDVKLFALGLDLMVPPLALQSMLLWVALMITGMASLFGISSEPFIVLVLGCMLFLGTILLAWYRFARDIISFKELLAIPGYILSKFSIYTSFIASRESKWHKTGRGDD